VTSARARCARFRAGEHPDQLVADLFCVGVAVAQDAGGDALVLLAVAVGIGACAQGDTFVLGYEAEQDVLGADVVVPEAQRFAQRQLEYLLRAWGERDLAGGDVLAGADDPNHSFAHAFNRDLKRLKDARGYALFFAQQPKQDVLGADVVVVQCPRLSSWARTITWRARSVNRSNTPGGSHACPLQERLPNASVDAVRLPVVDQRGSLVNARDACARFWK
jgi:hypothetical protein